MHSTSLSLPNSQYPDLPGEDSFEIKDNIFVVADGITRDAIGYPDYSAQTPEILVKNYPNPSPAKKASELFCRSFVNKLSNIKNEISEDLIRKAFIYGNRKIKELNKRSNPNPDYLEKDFWGCVACGGVIKDNVL